MADTSDSPVAFVAGITGSIGQELARRLVNAGWRVGGFARNPDRMDVPGVAVVAADATDSAAVQGAFAKLAEKLGPPSAYVHAVGSIILKPAHLTKDEDWLTTIDLNLNSAFYGLREAVKQMKCGGSIVMISSTAAQVGLPSHEAIAAAKGGVEALARSAAATYASKGIRVNSVALGLVESNMSQPMLSSETGRKISEAMHPLGRVGQPTDAASLIAWLCSEDASWVTGQQWACDGGVSSVRQKAKL
ncbi:SDR family NAD(P)-dependent oxidoreductase [Cerasicoccus maritimus]|uniref:SDR family NAD(P)-dependent oxidoreductase n=1 Tax=Cerasicoccus maritimus TaxID=490089 RepID=UPI00285266CB|nr:SDR family oxidoreductase [Cerasicoccus maritimus]